MSNNLPGPQTDEELKNKARWLTLLVFVMLAALMLRLVQMQIFKGSYYEELSRNNRIRIVKVKAPRGKIVDRNGIVLADNRPVYNVMLLPEDIRGTEEVAETLAGILESDSLEIGRNIAAGMRRPYEQFPIAKDITYEQMSMIEAHIFDLPGISIEPTTERDYVYKDLAAHVLGFLGEVDRREMQSDPEGEYSSGDLIGKSGVEEICEEILRGRKGTRIFEVDAIGRKIRVLDEVYPEAGKEVRLSLDKRLQDIARNAIGDKTGVVIAMDPQTGQVLSLVNSPRFDPNMFLTPIAPETWKQITEDPLHPLENRAIRGQYPPASIYKIFVGLAGLASGVFMPDQTVNCPGSYTLGDHTYGCWKASGHGEIDLVRAIGESCDVYFYRLGEELGIDRISQYSLEFGLGRKTGIELPGEVAGLIPTREWKQRRFGRPWMPGETINTSIGQGYTLVTPLQIAKGISAVGNGGRRLTPHILADSEPSLEKQLEIGEKDLDLMKDAMRSVVEGRYGTGRGIRDPMFAIGGKTGTAQVVAKGHLSKLPDESDIPYKYRDHAWFVGFSPVESPEIVVACVVEHGGHGGSVAAPIVNDVIKGYYFLKGISDAGIFQAD